MNNNSDHIKFRVFPSFIAAAAMLGIFIGWNYWLEVRSLKANPGQREIPEREYLHDSAGLSSRRLEYHDFESGNAPDTASHLALTGHTGKQSLRMNSAVAFSPGLWVKFKDLKPGDSSWIRVTGYVWFSCAPGEVKCNLVATCNHKGVNFKYMFVPLEFEDLKPHQWNRVSIDYHIPQAPDEEDVLQAYFWYRGSKEMLVDNIEVVYYTH